MVSLRSISLFVALACGVVGWVRPAHGQTELFRSGGFTWDTTTPSWGTVSGGPYAAATWNNATELRAVFEGTAGTATLGEAITAHSLRFALPNWIVTGNTLTLAGASAGAGTIEVAGTSSDVTTINSVLAGSVGLTKTGGGVLQIGTAGTYTGTTAITAGTFRPAFVNNVFNPTGAYVLSAGAVLSLANTTQSIGSLAGVSGNVTLGSGTLTIGGDNTSTTYAGVFSNTGTVVKTGTGNLTLGGNSTWTGPLTINGGVVSIDSATRLNLSSTADINLNGGTLRSTNPGNAGSFVAAGRTLVIGANGGTVDYTSSGAGTVTIYAGTITGAGNTLTKAGPGEFRYQGAGTANSTFSKLVVTEGLFRLGSVSGNNFETGFGAAPASPLADAITLNGGSIGTSYGVTLNANRGITLGANGGSINTSAGAMTIPGVITGAGTLSKNTTGTLTLTGSNDYTGGTTVSAGTLVVNNTAGSGTGTGAVNVTGGTLTGNGTLSGAVTVGTSGTLNPGTSADKSLNTGSTVGLNGTHLANLFGTGTTDQGQLITGGQVTLGGASTIRLALSGVTAEQLRTAVGIGNSRTYTVIDSGATSVSGTFNTTDFATAGFGADEWQVLYNQGGLGNVQLVFTPVPEPATVLAVCGATLGLAGAIRRRRTAGGKGVQPL